MIKELLYSCIILFICTSLFAQEPVYQTFKDTRVINTHTIETVAKRKLDVRIGHRFGDLFGDGGGWATFYGLESAADILFNFEYGISDKLTVGIGRTKGAGPLRRLVCPSVKYRILRQSENGSPISITAFTLATISTMPRSENPDALNNFDNTAHRTSYALQALIARKFGDRFSLQLIPSYVHRNLVPFDDQNGLVSLGFATRVQINRVFGIIFDATFPFSSLRTSENGYYAPIGIGLEIDTGGHLFQVNFTNARGIMETDYIPYTTSSWGDGQFRLGFTISRLFNL